ncbi:hypothetical protein H9P43_000327 [Blastocladiella emersonii ATCC 22665]|nr:hypothetical protein H9P43_000327 [Blastocladiella emersonii ATCC 22665]
MKTTSILALLALIAATASAAPAPTGYGTKPKCRPHHTKDATAVPAGTHAVEHPAYGYNPEYKPNRPAYPWEDKDKPYIQPGHTPTTPAIPALAYGKKPVTGGPYTPGAPYTGKPNEPYCPGKGGNGGNNGGKNGTDPVVPPKPQPLPNDNKAWNMTLIHTNDIHAHLDQFNSGGLDCTDKNIAEHKCYGGAARIRTLVDTLRATKNNTFLVDAGDQFQGTLFYNYYKGNVTADFMNSLGYDAFAIGNHEFDDGPEHLGKFLRKLKFPALSSNMDVTDEASLRDVVAPYAILTKYGARLGVVGFITQTTPDISSTGKKVKFADPAVSVQKAIDELHKLGVQKVVAISHNGYEDDMRVASLTSGLSLIAGGHSHTLLKSNLSGAKGPYPTAVKNKDGKPTYIVQAKAWGEWVGVIDLSWNAESELIAVNGDPIQLTDAIPQHKATQDLVQQWRQPFDALAKTVIGSNPETMDRGACSSGSCALGNFVTDALRDAYTGNLGPNRPVIAMVNTGGLRASLPAGDITIGGVLTVLPFTNYQVEIEVDGQFVKDTLENVASDVNLQNGKKVTSFAQFSGLRATLDMNQAAGSRALNIEVLGVDGKYSPINLKENYAFATIDFIAVGGGDALLPKTFPDAKPRMNLSDLVMEYIKKAKAIGAYKDRRITVIPKKTA